jgi:amidase
LERGIVGGQLDAFAPALDQAAAIRRREVSSLELTTLYQDRINRYNDKLNAFCLLTPDLAEASARKAGERLDANEPMSSSLLGVTTSIKDLVSVAGYPFTYGSRAFAHNVGTVDYFAVERLKAAGCVILGKTTTPEFGGRPVTDYGLHGITRNPWALDRNSGGSSGGAASALAAGLCSISHGTDGGGSARIPASCCGVVGLKPSRGRISLGPILSEGWAGLAHQGVLARTVADAAAGLDAMCGHLPGDPYWVDSRQQFTDAVTAPFARLRLAFTTDAESQVDPEVASCVRAIAKVCESLGHHVTEAGPDTRALRATHKVITQVGIATNPVKDRALLDPINALAFAAADAVSGVDYALAVNRMRSICRNVVAFWDDYDVLVTPTLTKPAPKVGELGADPATARDENLDWLTFLYPYNSTGQPAISLPLGMTHDGLPIGVQLVGPPRGEPIMLALASELEAAKPWADRRPPGFD